MLKIGITGSIGSGKTTVCKVFETLGIPVYYADTKGNFLLQNNPAVKDAVLAAFGEKIISSGALIDRTALANIVFKDAAKLAELESIIHPAVFNDFQQWFAAQKSPYILKEAALLFESGSYIALDKIITVSASLETRVQRVQLRDHISREQILAREKRQWPEERKIEMADFVISNDEKQLLMPQILELHKGFLSGIYELWV